MEGEMRLPQAAIVGAVIALLLPEPGAAGLKAVASIYPISAIVREIAGDRVDVTTLVPAGSDPHHFELTPKKAEAIYDADVVFLIGGGFDGWVLPSAGRDLRNTRIVSFYEDFSESLLSMGNSFNPHFWLDPLYAKRMGEIVGQALCSLDTANCSFYRSNVERFAAEMDSINASISERLRKSGFRDFVAFHPAWSYFARRYGLHERATLEISPENEPSAKHIAEVVRDMISNGVKIIVAEQFSNPDLAQAVASQTGARIIYLDPLGSADMPDRDTYAKLLDHDVSAIENSVRKK
jgi:zinc transport system substrate-binding protein